MTTDVKKRIEYAPDQYQRPQSTSGPMSVILAPDEDVRWEWATTHDGKQYVNGYTIVKKPQPG